ncbi:GCN5 family acetyltransferase [Vibrio fluvialis]|nr:GCN5 family acetyltransferase [Vibrio fluvialis]
MEIISFNEKYRGELRALYLASRATTFTWLNSSKFHLLDFDHDTQDELIWIALDFGKVVGFISIWEQSNFIHHLYVDPKQLNKGVGAKLLGYSKQHFSSLSLKCFIQNDNAIKFYQKHDFIICSTMNSDAEQYHLMKYEDV